MARHINFHWRARERVTTLEMPRQVPIFILAAILATGASVALPAAARSQAPQDSGQQQKSAQQSSAQPQSSSSAAPSHTAPSSTQQQPGMTAKERQNLQHEMKTGTSKDRLFWALPNFLTVEDTEKLPPLTSGQKFKVVGLSLIDPSEFLLTAVVAGIGQAVNSTPSYGQGFQGYAKRYGTAYGDNAVENFMASAALPSILHQDPRYYQLGHGGFWRRTGHAFSRLILTRSDAGQTQFNYSETFGAGIAAAISSYTYHPQGDRGFSNVVTVWGTQMGYDAGTYMLKEFWPDLRRKFHKKKDADNSR